MTLSSKLPDVLRHPLEGTKEQRLYSLIWVIRQINQALLRIKDETELFRQICTFLTRVDYIKFAWIGIIQEGSFQIKPVAEAGFEEGYLSTIRVTWDDSEYGQGPTGIAIKTARPFVMRNIRNDARFAPWKKAAVERGYNSSIALPLLHEEGIVGALNVYSNLEDAFGEEEIEFLSEVAGDIALGIRTYRLQKNLERSLADLQAGLAGTVEAIITLYGVRDPYTMGHGSRVAQLACAISKMVGFSQNQVEGMKVIGNLHDIGKIVAPGEILNKTGPLTQYELALIKQHALVAYDILKGLKFPWPVAKSILQHHERLDGSGYPAGLSGDNIIIEARILAVADVVEAMSSHRPYRPSLGIDKALEEIARKKGVLYDSQVVDSCLKLFTEKCFKFD
jgi:HD-GYP domain-containing protein (c-di-GMP phosphodiesterase class II)